MYEPLDFRSQMTAVKHCVSLFLSFSDNDTNNNNAVENFPDVWRNCFAKIFLYSKTSISQSAKGLGEIGSSYRGFFFIEVLFQAFLKECHSYHLRTS